jgi:hypothetical protein
MQQVEARDVGTFRLGVRARLVVASFLMLFCELALIRWVSAYQVHVAYFTNFVLLASFLGIGVGFLRAGKPRDLSRWAPAIFAAVLAGVFVLRVVKATDSDALRTAFDLPAQPIFVMLPFLFLGSVFAMAAIAEGAARLFARFDPLDAYRLDIAGSLGGIVVFSVMSFLQLGPLAWGLVIATGFIALAPRGDRGRLAASVCVGPVLAIGSLISPLDSWSPYYRVTVRDADGSGRIGIVVNSLPHQSMLPLAELEQRIYSMPYRHLPRAPRDVLIVGAGNGNDVALALSRGVRRIDAVEIDPVIQEAGRDRHPAQPYRDPRVVTHIDDGRAFLERTDGTYDLILFALPDSLTLVSGQGSLRLESYLFTREAMETVRDHLRPGGAFAMYNYYRDDVFRRYAETMSQVFGHDPCFDDVDARSGPRRQAVLTVSSDASALDCETRAISTDDAPAPSTDDHPFPYVPGRTIPPFYLGWLGGILLASVLVVRLASGAPLGQMSPYVDLFFMGAAFLLLETKSVVQFALLFGTTWFVNSLVFAGILVSVLAAIEVARRIRRPNPILMYGALLACLGVAWIVPPASLLALAPVPRFGASALVAFAPVFVANLIFAERFRGVGSSTVAFGANLLGAMLGGVLEYLAIATGYRMLLVVVALLYGLAFVTVRRRAAWSSA